MHTIVQYSDFFIDYLKSQIINKEPKNLYDPIAYMLSLEGKRVRPILTLVTTEIFDKDFKLALPAALAVEVYHNSSLVHDDIIDNDIIRRGKPTIRNKWNDSTAILSGDAMIALTYHYLDNYEPSLAMALIKVINTAALLVCEGQQWDIDFENRENVTVSEYLKMIECKTAALIGASMKIGAIIAQTSQENCNLTYTFGFNLGMAFQLQDDYLDVFGNAATLGKQLGRDIIKNKKTYLYLKALELATVSEKEKLMNLYAVRLDNSNNDNKIKTVTDLFYTSGASKIAQEKIEEYTIKAFQALDKINVDINKKKLLKTFGKNLMKRQT